MDVRYSLVEAASVREILVYLKLFVSYSSDPAKHVIMWVVVIMSIYYNIATKYFSVMVL